MNKEINKNSLSVLVDRLLQRNIPDYEIDSIVDTARGIVDLSSDQLGKIETIASAKRGNRIIEYHNNLTSHEPVSDKMEELKMKIRCRKSFFDPSIDFEKLSDYITYDENKTHTKIDFFYNVENVRDKRTQEDASKKAYIAAKFVTYAVKKGEIDDGILRAVDSIVDAEPKLAVWGAAIMKKVAISENLAIPMNNPYITEVLGDKLPEFKLSLGYDMIDRATKAGVPLKGTEVEYILSETQMPPFEKLGVIRSYLDNGNDGIVSGIYSAMEKIARQSPQCIPEIMNLLSHRKMEVAHSGRDYYNFDHDWVIRACVKQKPELMTQELYDNIRNKIERSGAWREDPVSGKVVIETQHTVSGYSEDRDVVSYMDSVNSDFKKQWLESKHKNSARINSNSGGKRIS